MLLKDFTNILMDGVYILFGRQDIINAGTIFILALILIVIKFKSFYFINLDGDGLILKNGPTSGILIIN